MAFNGANVNENMDVSANGGRVRFSRNVANITMDLNDVESIVAKTLGGADNLVVNDLSGTDVADVVADLAAAGGGDDGSRRQRHRQRHERRRRRDASPAPGRTRRSAASPPWSRCPAPSRAATG